MSDGRLLFRGRRQQKYHERSPISQSGPDMYAAAMNLDGRFLWTRLIRSVRPLTDRELSMRGEFFERLAESFSISPHRRQLSYARLNPAAISTVTRTAPGVYLLALSTMTAVPSGHTRCRWRRSQLPAGLSNS